MRARQAPGDRVEHAPSPAARRRRGRRGRSRRCPWRRARGCARRSPRSGRRGASAPPPPASSSTSAWSSCRPCGEKAITRRPAGVAVDGLERGADDVDAQHHPGAAAVRLVVDLAAGERRVVAVVEEAQVELGRRARPRAGAARSATQKACGSRVKTSICIGCEISFRARTRARSRSGLPRDRPRARTPRRAGARSRPRARARRSPRPAPRPRTRPSARPPSSTTARPTSSKT